MCLCEGSEELCENKLTNKELSDLIVMIHQRKKKTNDCQYVKTLFDKYFLNGKFISAITFRRMDNKTGKSK